MGRQYPSSSYVMFRALFESRLTLSVKWDPTRTDPVFVLQSGCMYAQYYEVCDAGQSLACMLNKYHTQLQIMIHRCFIPTPQKPSQTTFPSLAICTNAARSCVQIISSCRRRLPQWRGFIFQVHFTYNHCIIAYQLTSKLRDGGIHVFPCAHLQHLGRTA